MKYLKYIKKPSPDAIFISMIVIFGCIYFIVYRTQDRVIWYNESYKQLNILFQELRNIVGLG